MTFAPVWRTRLFASAGTVLGIVLGALIATESFFWPAICIGSLAALIVIYVQRQSLTTLMLGGLIVGYIVGNRGFAQLSLTGSFPLLPAEFVLIVGLTLLCVQSAWRREMPVRRDVLNVALLVWILIGTIRLLFGLRSFGFSAVRDFALVYYGLFFFLAQNSARDPAAVRFLSFCFLSACAALLAVYPLIAQFPGFFLQKLTVRGVPLILVKGDLAGNFMALGSLLFYARFDRSRKLLWLAISGALALLMLTTESRSSMVGLVVGAAWLALAGRWRFAVTLGVGAIGAVVAMFVAAEVQNVSWRQMPIGRVYERVMSIADPMGQRTYQSEDAFKADNNLFRMVWWRAAVAETIETNPWIGVGFGHDLALRFVREYYPEGGEEFTARSPHNVLITIFARMGALGFAVFLVIVGALASRTWRALRAEEDAFHRSAYYWCGVWALLVCACFGVMLEGPMGAVVFWTLLGLANAQSVETEAAPDEATTVSPVSELALPAADASVRETAAT